MSYLHYTYKKIILFNDHLADNGSFFIQARHIGYIAELLVKEAKSMLRSRNFNTNESLTSFLVSFFFIRLFVSLSSLKIRRNFYFRILLKYFKLGNKI